MRIRTNIIAVAALAALLAACTPPTPPATKITVAQVQSSAVTGVLPVTVSTGVRLQATTSTPLTLNWNVNGVAGGNSTLGAVNPAQTVASSDGIITFTAPANVPNPATINVQACNAATPSECGALSIKIIQPGEGGISGTVTLPAGLLSSTPLAPQAVSTASQSVSTQSFQADWTLPHAPGQVLIVSNPASGLGIASASSLRNLRLERVTDSVSRVRVPAGQDDQAFAARVASETGAFVQPNYLYRPLATPNDTLYAQQFYLPQIDAPKAWDTRKTVPNNFIAVLDTGVDKTHPDLQGRFIAGPDFCPTFNSTSKSCEGNDSDPTDTDGHGTHTLGLIAAATDNNAGIAGLTWGGTALAIKVFGSDGSGSLSDSATLATAVRYAADQGVKVINLSLGLPTADTSKNPDKLFAQALDYAANQKDVLVIAAAGNYQPSAADASKVLFYPASDTNTLPVGAVDANNMIAPFSARGSSRVLMAPGMNQNLTQAGQGILSTKLGGGYEARNGTSEAAPLVAGVAALVRAQNPNLTQLQVRGILQSTAKNIGPNTTYGFGLVQAGAAIAAAGAPAPQTQATVYVYADKYKGDPSGAAAGNDCSSSITTNCYDGNDQGSGRSIVIIPGKSGSGTYAVTLSRAGKPLESGIYRIVACLDKNDNKITCDVGDLSGRGPVNINYSGTPITGQNVTLEQK